VVVVVAAVVVVVVVVVAAAAAAILRHGQLLRLPHPSPPKDIQLHDQMSLPCRHHSMG